MGVYAIGDIHGCLKALQTLDAELQFKADDCVITLGDYVDRGPDSSGVIEYLLEMKQRCQLISLRGNHEVMMLDARENPATLLAWIYSGGDATLRSYPGGSLENVPTAHWDFLEASQPYYETEHDLFVHANIDPMLPMENQSEDVLYWKRIQEQSAHVSGKRLICGHTPQKTGIPWNQGHAVCLDTHIYAGGWLTCLNVKTQQYWQANQKGELRSAILE